MIKKIVHYITVILTLREQEVPQYVLTSFQVALAIYTFSENNFNRFLPQAPQLQNQNNLGTQAAVIGSAIPLGFIAFNGGSQASITSEGDGVAVSKAVVSTIGK